MPRVYASVSSDAIAQLLAEAQCRADATFGVTPRLREALPDEDDEGHEHLATQLAAAASHDDPVVVAVFDVPGSAWAAADDAADAPLGLLRITSELRHRDLVCFLVADPGEQVSDEADLELSWYDAGELPAVLDLAGQ